MINKEFEDSDPICEECNNQFDDNPGSKFCKTCEDWIVTEEE